VKLKLKLKDKLASGHLHSCSASFPAIIEKLVLFKSKSSTTTISVLAYEILTVLAQNFLLYLIL
jgi:hypothetical protein